MTLKEAVLKCLDDSQIPLGYLQVLEDIKSKSYFSFDNIQNPETAIGSILGTFIRVGDVRVRRLRKNRRYLYYLAKYEHLISNELEVENLNNEVQNSENSTNSVRRRTRNNTQQDSSYLEIDLHPLLITFINEKSILSKTINHAKNSKDSKSVWTNPDVIGVKFTDAVISNDFLRNLYKSDCFMFYSFEIKKEIRNDNELKEFYFQAVSNSSWANYGYLVALDFSQELRSEMNRLNQSFGIGFIQLNSNPYECDILIEAKFKELDLVTIDKLSKNTDVKDFLKGVSAFVNAKPENQNIFKNEFLSKCDIPFENEEEAKKHSIDKFILIESTSEDEN